MSKIITINLGNRGAIITLQQGNTIKNKIFINKLAENTVDKVKKFFDKHKKAEVYILLDTVAQNYNHKTFPAVNRFDLFSIVKRKFEYEIPKEDLKGKFLIDRDKLSKKWNYMFISSPIASPLKEWLELFDKLPNRLRGIYMVPLEMCKMAKKLTKNIKLTGDLKPKWLLLITQNKVSDLRQIAIRNNILIFTRLLSQDLITSTGFADKLKGDILRTGEYLKRFSSSFNMKDLTVITITEKDVKNKLLDMEIQDVKFIKLTPSETAKKINLSKFVNLKDRFSDILIRTAFIRGQKSLKFSNNKINKLNTLFNVIKVFFNSLLLIAVGIAASTFYLSGYKIKAETKRQNMVEDITNNSQTLRKKKEIKFGLEKESIDEIIDIGEISQVINSAKKDSNTQLQTFEKVQQNLGLTYSLSWTMDNFEYTNPTSNTKTNVHFQLNLLNPGGNIDDLFKKFDVFTGKLKKEFKNEKVSYSKLPSNIDFNKKYYYHLVDVYIK